MYEKVVTVKSIEFKKTAKDQTYMSAVFTDGQRENKYSVFDPAWQKLVQDAEKNGASLKIGLEKEGNFWNVKQLVVAEEGVSQKPPVPQTRNTETDKRDDILLSVAFKGACECEGYWFVPDSKGHEDRVLKSTAELYLGLKLILGEK